jgi:glutamate/tyrosine decarboxylase-like PLP-dependent enzyme
MNGLSMKSMENLLHKTAKLSVEYLGNLGSRPVFPSLTAINQLSQLGGNLPDAPSAPEKILKMLDEIGSPSTVASAGGRYFGFVVGGSTPVALAANWLAAAWDQNAMSSVSSPVAAKVEEIVIPWLLDLLHLPGDCAGALVTGAMMANFTALATARHSVLKRYGWNVEADGLSGSPPVSVIVSEQAHPTLLKAASLLGFGYNRLVRVPVDEQGRMQINALPPKSGPAIICIQAGNVNTGAFDPAEEICQLAKDAGAWVHVDGAFGLWAAASPNRCNLTTGIANADSWATDAHKWLNVPYDSGLVFVRDRESLEAAMMPPVAYLPQGNCREPWKYTPEASRRARGIEIWAALRSLGRSGVADIIERTCCHATRFANGLRKAGYAILNDVVLNQVLVSFGSDDKTQRVLAAIQDDGTCWCSTVTWMGKIAMRISVSSWATTDEDVEQSLSAILRLAADC